MRTQRWLVGALLVACAACSKAGALEQTQANMAKMQSGNMDLQLSASAGAGTSETGPVGFRLQGPFSLSGDHKLAVFSLSYTQLLGDSSSTTKVLSTGSAAFVDTGAKTYRVAEKDLGSLRLADDPSGGIGELGIAGWVEQPKTTTVGDTQTITGTVDAADMLSDLARVAGDVGGDAGLVELKGDAADRVNKLVRSSSVKVVTSAKSHQLRSLHAVVDFGTRTPSDLKRTLGKYARARIDVRLTMHKLGAPLRVRAPSSYSTLG